MTDFVLSALGNTAGYIVLFAMTAIAAYLLGSINFGIIVVKLKNDKDVRQYGSGGAGATNVMRNFGKSAALLTTLGDFSKGALALFLGRFMLDSGNIFGLIATYGAMAAALFAVLGHTRPLFFGFKGGKGVVTSASVLLFVDWRVFLIGLGVFIIVFVFTRTVSAGSILGSFTAPFTMGIFHDWDIWLVVMMALLAAWVIYCHSSNIKRLLKGTEPKLSLKKSEIVEKYDK